MKKNSQEHLNFIEDFPSLEDKLIEVGGGLTFEVTLLKKLLDVWKKGYESGYDQGCWESSGRP